MNRLLLESIQQRPNTQHAKPFQNRNSGPLKRHAREADAIECGFKTALKHKIPCFNPRPRIRITRLPLQKRTKKKKKLEKNLNKNKCHCGDMSSAISADKSKGLKFQGSPLAFRSRKDTASTQLGGQYVSLPDRQRAKSQRRFVLSE